MKAVASVEFDYLGKGRLLVGDVFEVTEERFKKLKRSGFATALEIIEEDAVTVSIETATNYPTEQSREYNHKHRGRPRRG
jgi:hypothetical protein